MSKGFCTLFLVRHGKTPTTGTALPGRDQRLGLSEEGRKEAHLAATLLEALLKEMRVSLAAIYSSPMLRARQTAKIIASALGHNDRLLRASGMNEVDPGAYTGKSFAELEKARVFAPLRTYAPSFRFEKGEWLVDARARCFKEACEIAASHEGKGAIVVSHADPIKLVVLEALQAPLDALESIEISTASVTALRWPSSPGSRPVLLCLNQKGLS